MESGFVASTDPIDATVGVSIRPGVEVGVGVGVGLTVDVGVTEGVGVTAGAGVALDVGDGAATPPAGVGVGEGSGDGVADGVAVALPSEAVGVAEPTAPVAVASGLGADCVGVAVGDSTISSPPAAASSPSPKGGLPKSPPPIGWNGPAKAPKMTTAPLRTSKTTSHRRVMILENNPFSELSMAVSFSGTSSTYRPPTSC